MSDWFAAFATRTAAATAVPPEPPISRPSSRATRRAMRNESSSLTAITPSITDGSYVSGQKSSPTPSTMYGRPDPPEYTDPSGSAPMIRTAGFCSFRYRPMPVMVPPVPRPATKCVTRPAVCRQISGPVVS